MNLETIAQTLNEAGFNIAESSIKVSRQLGDTISIKLSLDKRETWSGGILQNSRWMTALVFCETPNNKEVEGCNYTFHVSVNRTGVKVSQKLQPVNGEAILKHITAQLNKF